jgi:hypothetical protein
VLLDRPALLKVGGHAGSFLWDGFLWERVEGFKNAIVRLTVTIVVAILPRRGAQLTGAGHRSSTMSSRGCEQQMSTLP